MLRKIAKITTILTLLLVLAACGATGSEPGVDDTGPVAGDEDATDAAPTEIPDEGDETEEEDMSDDESGMESLPPAPERLALVDSSWQLVEFGGGPETERPIDTYGVTLEFDEVQISGNAGCNGFGASYSATNEGELSFDTDGFFSTMMACPEGDVMDVEAAYLEALRSVTGYEIGESELRLTYENGVLVFQPPVEPEPEPLEGTAWFLNVIEEVSGDAVSATLPQNVVISATFEDGQLSGNSGCNQYSASYTLGENNEMSIGPAATTRMACPEEIMAQEMSFLQALQETTGYEIEGAQLRLINPDGALIFQATDPAETDPQVILDRIAAALQAQNLDLLGENMTMAPSLAIWPEEAQVVSQAELLDTLADGYLVEGSAVTVDEEPADAAALPGMDNLLDAYAGNASVLDARLSQGWGANGAGEALLWIVQQTDGKVRLGGLVLAPQGF